MSSPRSPDPPPPRARSCLLEYCSRGFRAAGADHHALLERADRPRCSRTCQNTSSTTTSSRTRSCIRCTPRRRCTSPKDYRLAGAPWFRRLL
eukprot:1695004-Prymnesium_polylepis.2